MTRHCPQQFFDVLVPQIVERIVEVGEPFHGERIPERVIGTDPQHVRTHKVVEKILNLTQQVANAQDAKNVSRHDPAVNW